MIRTASSLKDALDGIIGSSVAPVHGYQRGFVRPEDVQPDDVIEPADKHDVFEATAHAHLLSIENQIRMLEARRLAVTMSLKSPSRTVLVKRPIPIHQAAFGNVATSIDIGPNVSSQRSTLIAEVAGQEVTNPVVRGAACDGVTDDTNAIQRALHAAATEAVSKADVAVIGCNITCDKADERSICDQIRDATHLSFYGCRIAVGRGHVIVRDGDVRVDTPPGGDHLVQRTDELGRTTFEKATTNAVIPSEAKHGQFWSSLVAMTDASPRPDQVNVSDALAKTSDFLATPFGDHAGDRVVHYHIVICGCGYRMVRPFEHRFGACFSCGSTESIRDLDAESCVMTPACVAAGGKAPVH